MKTAKPPAGPRAKSSTRSSTRLSAGPARKGSTKPAAKVAPTAAAARLPQRAKEAINAALELFNRRWVLRVLWELRGEAMSFRALQSACGDLSPTVLNQRLAELREAALVDAGEAGYALTPLGRELIVAFEPLTAWALRWQGQRR